MRLMLLSGALLAVSAANAFNVSYDWSKVLTNATKTTTAYDAVLTTEGNYYMVMGSDVANDIQWGGEALTLPADEGTDAASKAIISKMDYKGDISWSITSVNGAFSLDNGKTALMPDGGAVIALIVRKSSKDASIDPLATLVDAKGNKVNITIDGYPEAWAYAPVIMKFSADGEIEWWRQLKSDFSAVNGTVPTQPAYITALTTDPDGNIYIGGLYQTSLSFPVSATTWSDPITPVNTPSNWNASGTAVGDMYIAKLDKDGSFVKVLTATATEAYAARDQVSRLTYADGVIYWLGQVVGTADAAPYTLGTTTITPSKTDVKALETTLVGALTPDLTTIWTTSVETTANPSGSAVIQNKNLNVGSSAVYATGALNGGMKLGASAITSQKAALEGYIAGFSKADGTPTGGAIYGTSISGYYGMVENGDNGHLVAYGYQLSTKAYLVEYNADYTTPSETVLIQNGQPMTFGCTFNPDSNQFLSLSRGKGAGTSFGNTITCPTQFSAVVAAYTFSDFKAASGVEAVDAVAEGVSVCGTAGCAVFTAAEAHTVAVYSAAGMLVKNVAVAEGTTTVELPAGFYIAAGQKFIVR